MGCYIYINLVSQNHYEFTNLFIYFQLLYPDFQKPTLPSKIPDYAPDIYSGLSLFIGKVLKVYH